MDITKLEAYLGFPCQSELQWSGVILVVQYLLGTFLNDFQQAINGELHGTITAEPHGHFLLPSIKYDCPIPHISTLIEKVPFELSSLSIDYRPSLSIYIHYNPLSSSHIYSLNVTCSIFYLISLPYLGSHDTFMRLQVFVRQVGKVDRKGVLRHFQAVSLTTVRQLCSNRSSAQVWVKRELARMTHYYRYGSYIDTSLDTSLQSFQHLTDFLIESLHSHDFIGVVHVVFLHQTDVEIKQTLQGYISSVVVPQGSHQNHLHSISSLKERELIFLRPEVPRMGVGARMELLSDIRQHFRGTVYVLETMLLLQSEVVHIGLLGIHIVNDFLVDKHDELVNSFFHYTL